MMQAAWSARPLDFQWITQLASKSGGIRIQPCSVSVIPHIAAV
jgi:hypothetical protein